MAAAKNPMLVGSQINHINVCNYRDQLGEVVLTGWFVSQNRYCTWQHGLWILLAAAFHSPRNKDETGSIFPLQECPRSMHIIVVYGSPIESCKT